jgi:hypothetical protein
VKGEYCWAITQAAGRSCCGRSSFSVLEFGFQLESVIQSDQKVSVQLMITIHKVTSNVQSVPRQSPDIYWLSELLSKTVFSIARFTFRMCSVMAIFRSSIMWGLFEYAEFLFVFYCNHQVYRDFLINIYIYIYDHICSWSRQTKKLTYARISAQNFSVILGSVSVQIPQTPTGRTYSQDVGFHAPQRMNLYGVQRSPSSLDRFVHHSW